MVPISLYTDLHAYILYVLLVDWHAGGNVWDLLLTYADVCWRMLTYADVCWRMLTGGNVGDIAESCWRMLTYADVCWRMLTGGNVGDIAESARLLVHHARYSASQVFSWPEYAGHLYRLCDRSGKHKIISNAPNGALDFCWCCYAMDLLCTKKAVMPKKKDIAARNLKDWTKFTTQINNTTKKRQFYAFLSN